MQLFSEYQRVRATEDILAYGDERLTGIAHVVVPKGTEGIVADVWLDGVGVEFDNGQVMALEETHLLEIL